MRHVFIANPNAGRKKALSHLRQQAMDLFGADHCDFLLTQYPGHARELARAAAEQGEPVRIYACGGDGTLNEVVNGAAGVHNAAVTNIPQGTGNDFLKLFGSDWQAAFSDLAALSQGPQAAFDLMDCNGHLGINIVCAGIDARVAADVHHYKRLPLVAGIGAYILSLVANVFFKDLACPIRATVNAELWDQDTTILCVCNGRYYGGGFMPVGEAMPDDGALEVLLVPRVSRVTFLRLVRAYATGRYADYPELIRFHRTQAVEFSSPNPLTVVVDGEVIRDQTFTLRLSEKKINFFYPQGVSYQPAQPLKAEAGVSTPAGRL